MSTCSTAAKRPVWRLKRYGRYDPGTGKSGGQPWKVFEAGGSKPDITLTIVEPGYLLVLQGDECLDTIPLMCGSDFLKIHQKSDNLIFRVIMKEEGRMTRMQFDGSDRTKAVKECLSAVEKLKEFTSVTTQDDTPPPHNQPPAEASAPVTQDEAVEAEPEVDQAEVSIKRLMERFRAESRMTLPQVYHQCPLTEGDFEPILRVCLLDPSFPAFVERVEAALKKLPQE